MNPDVFVTVVLGVLGLLVGSFTNVLIWRLPRHESVAFPPSHCPKCDHPLGAADLVPVVSWLALGGKCRYCKAPIRARYPVIELISGVAYGALGAVFPFSTYGAGVLGLCVLFTILLAASVIDAETYTIPDLLTLGGVVLGLLFGVVNAGSGALALHPLPDFMQALRGALLGAGVLVAIDLFGSWVLRRFRERSYPETPIGYQQIALGLCIGALAGGLGGWSWGVTALLGLAGALVSTTINVAARRAARVPELLTLVGSLVVLALLSREPHHIVSVVQGALAGAGAVSLLAGVYWYLKYSRSKPQAEMDDSPSDPNAMGFGDVKLAAVIGAFLGFEALLLALAVAVVGGAVLGVAQRIIGGENRLKFGPYLALGAVVALLWGDSLMRAYQGWLGL